MIEQSLVVRNNELALDLFGLRFSNPVGLAAGFDKNAEYIELLSALGFGFVEIGTVTPLPQQGNDKPRLFRLTEDEALINRMGFNNDGADAIVQRLRKRKNNIIVGGNIGKNKQTPNLEAVKDYEICFEKLFDFVDYFVVNVSSPNTPGLRELQDKKQLKVILQRLQELNVNHSVVKPILLKIAPDLNDAQLDDIVEIVRETKIAGIIATNTTISRANLKTQKTTIEQIGAGGLSGKPLQRRTTEIIRFLASKSANSFVIIGVGGIHSPSDALEKLQAGASLVQVYTGFIYEGPGLIKRINRAIAVKEQYSLCGLLK